VAVRRDNQRLVVGGLPPVGDAIRSRKLTMDCAGVPPTPCFVLLFLLSLHVVVSELGWCKESRCAGS
jgi:hypothetical protein